MRAAQRCNAIAEEEESRGSIARVIFARSKCDVEALRKRQREYLSHYGKRDGFRGRELVHGTSERARIRSGIEIAYAYSPLERERAYVKRKLKQNKCLGNISKVYSRNLRERERWREEETRLKCLLASALFTKGTARFGMCGRLFAFESMERFTS